MCSALGAVLDVLRPLVMVLLTLVQLRIMNGRKLTRVASSPISASVGDSQRGECAKETKTVPAVVAVSIPAGAWWVVYSKVRWYCP